MAQQRHVMLSPLLPVKITNGLRHVFNHFPGQFGIHRDRQDFVLQAGSYRKICRPMPHVLITGQVGQRHRVVNACFNTIGIQVFCQAITVLRPDDI